MLEGFVTSNGPNECFGHPSCRGIAAGCNGPGSGECQEFACCCDVCLHDNMAPNVLGGKEGDPCHGHCCRCVPKALVAYFTPGTTTAYCRERGVIMWAEHTLATTTYSAVVPGAGLITITIQRKYDDTCVWTLDAAEIYYSEELTIDYRTVKCSRPPSFTPINVTAGSFCGVDCTGSIDILLYEPEKLPFRRPDLTGQPTTYAHTCGDCTEVCWAICVRRREGGDYADIERYTFYWDEVSQSYKGGKSLGGGSGSGFNCGEEEFSFTEVGGVCYLKVDAFDIATFVGDLIAINECNIGLAVEAEDEDGNWISISCNKCSCWKYLCGECRCTCPTMCIVGGDATSDFGPLTLTWDELEEGWADGSGNVVIGVDGQINGDCRTTSCEVTVSGMTDPVAIPDKCGHTISISANEGRDDHSDFANFKWRHAWCSQGNPCDEGLCSLCDQVPSVIYADFEAVPLNSAAACIVAQCFTNFTVPMKLVHNPPGAAADYQWIGYHVFQCDLCLGGSVAELVQIVLGCDGQITIRFYTDDGTVIYEDSTMSINIPCSNCTTPLEETVDFIGITMSNGCCSEPSGGFQIIFTE